jgi:hypothetical protein
MLLLQLLVTLKCTLFLPKKYLATRHRQNRLTIDNMAAFNFSGGIYSYVISHIFNLAYYMTALPLKGFFK